ncbi:peroxide stress protein YaaA [Nocardioidaceae bacterium]|nr:peroxide stress protein YaaA [Nocardioidaceae bacterium]
MLSVISPAKSLDFDSKPATKKSSEPLFLDRSETLVELMREKSPADLQELMDISEDLAQLNHDRFADWTTPFTKQNARAAVLAFAGDTYTGLDAPATFDERDYTHAQKTLRILSGLHGVLRPLDLMQPYRLEMGTALDTPEGKGLHRFWRRQVTAHLAEAIDASPGAKVLVNAASQEYFGVVDADALEEQGITVVTPSFLDAKGSDEPKVVSFWAKQARGAYAGWLVRERITTRKRLTSFDRGGYAYDGDRSTRREPVFVRRHAS